MTTALSLGRSQEPSTILLLVAIRLSGSWIALAGSDPDQTLRSSKEESVKCGRLAERKSATDSFKGAEHPVPDTVFAL